MVPHCMPWPLFVCYIVTDLGSSRGDRRKVWRGCWGLQRLDDHLTTYESDESSSGGDRQDSLQLVNASISTIDQRDDAENNVGAEGDDI